MNDRTSLMVLIVFGILLGLVPRQGPATTLLPLNLDDLCAFSTKIVVGTVDSTWQAVSADRTHAWTVYRLNIEESIKGASSASRVEFTSPHGVIDSFTVAVAGAPRFRLGDELLLFLSDVSTGNTVIEGLNRGVFRVRRNSAGERKIVSYSGTSIIGVLENEAVTAQKPTVAFEPSSAPRTPNDQTELDSALSLDELSSHLRGIVREQLEHGYHGRFRSLLDKWTRATEGKSK